MVDSHEDEDDLFRHSSMSFGEHLEELRSALIKAVLACLVFWFCIGLWFAPQIVQLIQSPLERALKSFYSEEAVEYLERMPPEMRDDQDYVNMVVNEGLVPQEVFIDPREMFTRLREKFPEQLNAVDLPILPRAAAAKTTAEQAAPAAADKSSDAAKAPPASITKQDLIRVFQWRPLSEDERLKVESFNVQESFIIFIKAAFLFAAVFSSPFVFYFLWSFVAAGLYPHEKKYVNFFLPVSIGLFLAGAMLAFTWVFPPVLNFFFGVTKSMNQGIRPRISEWLSFVLLMPLGFGVAFQLPLLMLFLERIGVTSVEFYKSKRRIAVLLLAIAAMVLSPGGDPYSMMFMFVPLVCLYFGGLALCIWLPSQRRKDALAERAKAYAGVD